MTQNSLNSSSIAANHSSSLGMCSCLLGLQRVCSRSLYAGSSGKMYQGVFSEPALVGSHSYNSELGRMIYTISILLMFSFVILLLMIRSIRRSGSTAEVESLLESMRFREELDLQQRQKRRLQRAKNKVSAWLSRGVGKTAYKEAPVRQGQFTQTRRVHETMRTNSLQSGGSYIPEIVISNSDEGTSQDGSGPRNCRLNSCTPSLSLIYDFDFIEKEVSAGWSRKNSVGSSLSETGDLSVSDLTFNSSLDLTSTSVGGNGYDETATSRDEELGLLSMVPGYWSLGCDLNEEMIQAPPSRPASADGKKAGRLSQLSPRSQLSASQQATPTPTAATPVAMRQQFFQDFLLGPHNTGSRKSLQLTPTFAQTSQAMFQELYGHPNQQK